MHGLDCRTSRAIAIATHERMRPRDWSVSRRHMLRICRSIDRESMAGPGRPWQRQRATWKESRSIVAKERSTPLHGSSRPVGEPGRVAREAVAHMASQGSGDKRHGRRIGELDRAGTRDPLHHFDRTTSGGDVRHPSADVVQFDPAMVVGVTGFEPATSTSRRWRSTRLSYTPLGPCTDSQ